MDGGIADIRQNDLIVIPGFLFSLQQAMPEFGRYRAWLRECYQLGATIATLCNATLLRPKVVLTIAMLAAGPFLLALSNMDYSRLFRAARYKRVEGQAQGRRDRR